MTALAPGNVVGKELAEMYPELERFRERRDDAIQLFRTLRGIDYDERRPTDSELARFRRQITKERELLDDVDALLIHSRSFSRKHKSAGLTEFNRELHIFDSETNALFSLLRDEEKKIRRVQKHESLLFGELIDLLTPDNRWLVLGVGGAFAGTVTGTPALLENKGIADKVDLGVVADALSHNPHLSHLLYDSSVVGFAVAAVSSVIVTYRFVKQKAQGYLSKKEMEKKFLS
ncbi:MAG TPA: hypothetical protein VL944_00525 [Candidatus Acidoferrum sp.]|nr:hypothetical protein [Candidatus Acidoferrum sp.]